MKIIGIIPARYASSRLPAKALADIGGKSMTQRVYEQVCKADSLAEVCVATDDQRIFDHVKSFGGKVLMTAKTHESGTERCAEILDLLAKKEGKHFEAVVNIQGDEPFVSPQQIQEVIHALSLTTNDLATLIKRITSSQTLVDPNTPKVIVNPKMEAIYFSRQTIPFVRDHSGDKVLDAAFFEKYCFYKHLGIYAYRSDCLKKIVALKPSNLEQMERLEQLRWLENGFVIQTAETAFDGLSVDTEQDLLAARKFAEKWDLSL